MAEETLALSATSSPTTPQDHRRAAGQHQDDRTLSAAGQRPAGAEIQHQPEAIARRSRRLDLVVEVTEKPFDAIGRVDNRGTPSRGPYQFLTSATLNNLFGQHEALTVSYAGVWPLKELQYIAGLYRQVLTSEGLTAFVNGSYSWGRPGTAARSCSTSRPAAPSSRPARSIQSCAHASKPDAHRACFHERQRQRLSYAARSTSTACAGSASRLDADIADSLQGINQFNLTFSQGIDGLGSTDNGNPLASRAAGRVDFSKIEGTISRTQPLPARFSAYAAVYGQYAFTPLLRPSNAAMAGASSAAPSIPRSFSATVAGRRSASCATICRRRRQDPARRSSTASPITAQLYTMRSGRRHERHRRMAPRPAPDCGLAGQEHQRRSAGRKGDRGTAQRLAVLLRRHGNY